MKYRDLGRTLTHQVKWEKIRSLRAGGLYLTLPASVHFSYVKKLHQPLLVGLPEPGVIGVISLSCLMDRSVRPRDGSIDFRIVTHWRIKRVSLALNKEDWLFALGREIK